MEAATQAVEYDSYGRLKFHPEYHAKQGTPWTVQDQQYLIEHYDSQGPEAVSFAVERTIQTVMQRAYELRKSGKMEKPKLCRRHRIRTGNKKRQPLAKE